MEITFLSPVRQTRLSRLVCFFLLGWNLLRCGIWLMGEIGKIRCPVRCHRFPILVAVGFAFGFAESLHSQRDIGWVEWEGG